MRQAKSPGIWQQRKNCLRCITVSALARYHTKTNMTEHMGGKTGRTLLPTKGYASTKFPIPKPALIAGQALSRRAVRHQDWFTDSFPVLQRREECAAIISDRAQLFSGGRAPV